MAVPANDVITHASIARSGRSARFTLRDATGNEHEATEHAFGAFDQSRRDHYRLFLEAHAMVLPRFELGVTGLGWSGWEPRYPFLADDLAALGAHLPVPMLAPAISPVAAWGVQYVLEGSKLGGRVIAARLGAGFPARYLQSAPDMPARWQAFCAALDSEAIAGGPEWMNEVIDSAIETFQAFRRAAETLAGDLR